MQWLIFFGLITGFAVISGLAHWGILKIKNKFITGPLVLVYAIALYYFFYAITSLQEMLEMKGMQAYFDHDNILMGILILALCAIALLNLLIALRRRFKINLD